MSDKTPMQRAREYDKLVDKLINLMQPVPEEVAPELRGTKNESN